MRLFFPILLLALSVRAQEFTDLRIDRVAAGYMFTEGPVWSHEGYLLFSDVPQSKLLEFKPGAPATQFRENTNGAVGNTFDTQGRLYSCESHLRRVTRTDKKGKVDVLVDRWQGKKLNAPNDIVVRKDGQIYFTDPAFGNQRDHRELDFFGVYHLSSKGELSVLAKPKGRPNGIALAPNGRTLYVTNSDDRNVMAYDLDQHGVPSNERVLIPATEGIPGGIRVDEKGNLYIAANNVEVYSPDGKQLGKVQLHESASNCAFGDSDLETLYITAQSSVYRVRLGVKGSVQY